jgi:hypothetical protein
MPRLIGRQVESLFDAVSPVSVRESPADLARLEALLSDAALLAPIEWAWATARDGGRPTIATAMLVRWWWSSSALGGGHPARASSGSVTVNVVPAP